MSGAGAGGRFEGSFLGDASRIAATTRMECKICWTVYDPAEGDEVRQIAPGTPFAALPPDWRCPTCDGERDQFMTLDTPGAAQSPEPEAQPDAEAARRATAQRFKTVFTEIYNAKMRDTPLVNRSLSVETVGFRAWRDDCVGVLLSPWFMNLVLQPAIAPEAKIGDKRVFSFPSGEYEFVFNERPELGPYWACSLFSPMTEFQSQLQATDTASAVMAALFDPKNRSEDSDRAGEIRAQREAEQARAAAQEETTTNETAQGERIETAAEEGATAEVPAPKQVSRRALLTGGGAAQPGGEPKA